MVWEEVCRSMAMESNTWIFALAGLSEVKQRDTLEATHSADEMYRCTFMMHNNPVRSDTS